MTFIEKTDEIFLDCTGENCEKCHEILNRASVNLEIYFYDKDKKPKVSLFSID